MNTNQPSDLSDQRGLFDGDAASEALRVIAKLNEAGFVAYLAGGCVRDALLGRRPKDFDVATNATPDSVRELFGKRETLAFGASFGVIAVLPPRGEHSCGERSRTEQLANDGEIIPTEVATFRSDGEYSDGRRPDSVQFGTAEQDSLRRDFTINGMFYDPQSSQVIDFVGGKDDLRSGVLRTIGQPLARFGEDKLRMLRAVRFATTLGFAVHADTIAAIQKFADEIAVVSGERIGAEMRKVLTSPNVVDGLRLLQQSGLAKIVMPEIADGDISQLAPYLGALPIRDLPSTLACLLIGQGASAAALGLITARWKLSNEEQRQTNAAVGHARDIIAAADRPWSQVQPLLIHRDIGEVINVAEAVATAESLPRDGLKLAHEVLRWPLQKRSPSPLLTGDDLREHQFASGPIYRKILTEVRRAQLDGEISGQEEALAIAKRIVKADA